MRIGVLLLVLCVFSACQGDDDLEQTQPSDHQATVATEAVSEDIKGILPVVRVQEETQYDAVAQGKKVSKRCMGCHTFEQGGVHKVGPNLFGIWGKAKGSVTDFKYGTYLQQASAQQQVWDEAALRAWLWDAKAVAKSVGAKTNMPKQRMKGKKLDDLIVYLEGLR